MFCNTLTANDNYPVQDCGNLSSRIQMHLSLKAIISLIFLFYFWSRHQILNILKKNMIAIPTFFRKLQNVKNFVRPLSKKHRSSRPFDSQHLKRSQTLVNYAWEHFHHVFLSPLGDPDLENISLSDTLNLWCDS